MTGDSNVKKNLRKKEQTRREGSALWRNIQSVLNLFLIVLDLHAAFDTTDHNILLYTLEHVIRIKGTMLG